MTYSWHDVNIGGGGFVTGGECSNDDTKVIRCDVFGAYVATPSSPVWRQLFTETAFGANAQYFGGPYEITISKTDSNRLYLLAGFLFKSIDRGLNWTKVTAFNGGSAIPAASSDGNRNPGDNLVFATRNDGRYMVVDPHDPNVLYICTPQNGSFVTFDGGTSFQTISGIPAATTSTAVSLGTCVAIDPFAAPVNGRSPNVFIMAYGSQMLKCTNGGSATPTFAATTGGPTSITHMACDKDGTVYVVDNAGYPLGGGSGTGGQLWRYNGTSWTATGVTNVHAIAPDPSTAGRVVLCDDSGNISVSTTHGSTPTALSIAAKTAATVPWLAVTPNVYYTGDIFFEPVSGKLNITQGIGVATTIPGNSGSVTWADQSAGIEELVAIFVASSPAYPYPLVGAWDRPLFAIVDPAAFPTTQRPNNSRAITMGWGGDWAKSAPGTHAAIVNFDGAGDDSGISTDGGLTWTPWANKPNKVRLVTNAPSAAGAGVLHFASVPSLIVPSSLGGNRQAIYLGIAAVTTAPSAAESRVLHFGGGLPAGVTVPCTISTDEKQIINGVLFDSALTLNYLGVTGDVQIDGGPHVLIPTGTTIFFLVSGNPINGNVSVSATTSTSVTLAGEPSGGPIKTGETIEFTSGKGGCIALSTPTNAFWIGSNSEPYPWYTKDGGATPWKNAVLETNTNGFGSAGQALPNANGDGSGWGQAYYINEICVAADPVIANRFLLYNGRLLVTDGAGLWSTDDGGDTFIKRVTGRIGNNANQYAARILGVLGKAHNFLLSGAASNIGQNNPLMISTDSINAVWTQIARVSHVISFGVGAAKPGNDYPTVYMAGQVDGIDGLWAGEGNASDWAAGSGTGTTVTWTKIGSKYPNGWLNFPSFVEGDASVYGRVYVARGQSGVTMMSLDAVAPSGPLVHFRHKTV